jgi:hypothetical protein
MATKKKTTKKIMTIEHPPQAHEVRGTVAMELLGYGYLASVRKLHELGEIEGRKIGRDMWYDRRTIDAYNERKKGVGRPPIEDDKGDDPERVWMRKYQRDRRAGNLRRGQKASPSKQSARAAEHGSSKKAGKAAKGKAAAKGARATASSAAARGGAGAGKKAGRKGRR